MTSPPRFSVFAKSVVLVCVAALLASCGDSDNKSKTTPVTSVTLNLSSATVLTGGSVTFVATVVGGDAGPSAVTYSLDAGSCGSQAGAVSSSGTYTAGNPVEDCQVTVRAASVSDPSKTASAAVTVDAPVAVNLDLGSVTVAPSGTQAFVATVTGAGSGSTAVTWSVEPGSCPPAEAGSISASGLYTAGDPVEDCQVTVRAASEADATKSATAVVKVDAPIVVALDVAELILAPGGTHAFSATVTGAGTDSTAVAWSLDAGTCGAAAGTLSDSGLYAAGNPSADCEVAVRAASVADPAREALATISISVAPDEAVVLNAGLEAKGVWEPAVAMDTSGNVVAVWTQSVAEASGNGLDVLEVWSAGHSAAASDWAAPARLATNIFGWDFSLSEMTLGGIAYASWRVANLSGDEMIVASQVEGATGLWSDAGSISTGYGVGLFRIEGDGLGDAHCVWYEDPPYGERRMYASRRDGATGAWSTRTQIDSAVTVDGGISAPSNVYWTGLSADDGGNAATIWTVWHYSYMSYNETTLAVNRYVPGVGWTEAKALDRVNGDLGESLGSEDVVALGGGDFLAVWTRKSNSGQTAEIMVSRYSATTSEWSAPEPVYGPTPGTIWYTAVDSDGHGKVVIAWILENDNGYRTDVHAMLFDAQGSLWSTPALLETDTDLAYQVEGAIDSSGRAVVAWVRSPPSVGTSVPMAVRYEPSTETWGTPRPLAAEDSGNNWDPSVAVGGDPTRAAAVWIRQPSSVMGLILE